MPASLRSTLPLFDHLPAIASALRAAPEILLFLDFDGTLAPIVEDPSSARMPPETRQALVRLASESRFSLAIISGRALSDLRLRVDLEDLIYAGNHGLEISGPGVEFIEPTAAERLKALGELSRHLKVRLHDIPGVEVENKVLSASIHFRRAPAASLAEIREAVEDAVIFDDNPFEITEGRKVLEIRPRVGWHKGMAVRWIQHGHPGALPLYIGDDSTDEDAFLALPEGITIGVGKARETAAQYFLERQELVPEFLLWLAKHA
ncbi:MAG TPA: trehalose-phosphatase [Bryobacteraceae bacterium]|jgi:trehalose 6-phosphate phosphatase|nr:trehalose-phosphatase [Bryobacteraceae bacterium]